MVLPYYPNRLYFNWYIVSAWFWVRIINATKTCYTYWAPQYHLVAKSQLYLNLPHCLSANSGNFKLLVPHRIKSLFGVSLRPSFHHKQLLPHKPFSPVTHRFSDAAEAPHSLYHAPVQHLSILIACITPQCQSSDTFHVPPASHTLLGNVWPVTLIPIQSGWNDLSKITKLGWIPCINEFSFLFKIYFTYFKISRVVLVPKIVLFQVADLCYLTSISSWLYNWLFSHLPR